MQALGILLAISSLYLLVTLALVFSFVASRQYRKGKLHLTRLIFTARDFTMYIVFSLQLLGVESRHIHAYLPREVRLALSIAEATLLDLSAAFDSTCENSVHFDPRVGKIAISVYALLLTASLVALFCARFNSIRREATENLMYFLDLQVVS